MMFHVKQKKIKNMINSRYNKYIDLLLEYNKYANLISRKLEKKDIEKLIQETLILNKIISNKNIIDAGSGNGILGIPISLLAEDKNIVLVEPRKKKIVYLKNIVSDLGLLNVKVSESYIKDYLLNNKLIGITLIARGFPDNYELFNYLVNDDIQELILITIEDKIKKNKINVDNIKKYVYNIPSKDKLKIIKLEKVSRGT